MMFSLTYRFLHATREHVTCFHCSLFLHAWVTLKNDSKCVKCSLPLCEAFATEKSTKYCIFTKPRLIENQRNRAIGQLETWIPISEVGKRWNLQQRIVWNLWWRFQQWGVTADLPWSGRTRITSRAEDHFMQLLHLRNHFLKAQETANTFQGLNAWTWCPWTFAWSRTPCTQASHTRPTQMLRRNRLR